MSVSRMIVVIQRSSEARRKACDLNYKVSYSCNLRHEQILCSGKKLVGLPQLTFKNLSFFSDSLLFNAFSKSNILVSKNLSSIHE
jgi:hypothetical protein